MIKRNCDRNCAAVECGTTKCKAHNLQQTPGTKLFPHNSNNSFQEDFCCLGFLQIIINIIKTNSGV